MTPSPRLLHLGVALLIAVLLPWAAGCEPASETSAPSDTGADTSAAPATRFADVPGTGSEKMAAILRTIHEEALEHPMEYFHLNAASAEVLRKRIETTPPEQKPSLRYAYASQLLNSGQTRAAIRETAQLIQDLGLSLRSINPQARPLFELLAIAYMRMGEQQNCIDNHSAASCILPISGEGVHTQTEGSRRAIALYDRLLRGNRGDLQSRWLLNVAHMTLGQYPEGVPEPVRIPGIEASDPSPVRRFTDVAMRLGVDHNALAGGTSVDDFNGDGFLDILATSYGLADPMKLYLSDGRGGFTDHTLEAGLDGIVGGLNTVHADYDNDGDADVFILRGAWLGENGQHPNSLLRNDGDGSFTDVTFEAGLDAFHPTQVAAWADVNRDGWIDLFVGNESNAEINFLTGQTTELDSTRHPSALYLNDGDGTFTNVAAEVGMELNAYVKGATFGDANGDGRPDLYVSILGGPNRLYMNEGDAPGALRFANEAKAAGVEAPIYSFPTWFWDYDNDGDDDLFVSGYDMRYLSAVPRPVAAEYINMDPDVELPRVYRNRGDGTFEEVSAELGLDKVMFSMGSNYGDLDGDGFQDFYVGTGAPDLRSLVPNRMFRNDGGTGFTEVTFAGGFGHIQKGHAVAFADFDRDGDQDVYSVMGGAIEGDTFQNVLFENPGHGNHWITLVLEGRTANRSAIGARLTLTVRRPDGSTRTIHWRVGTGGSFGASSLQQEIGLGGARRIDTLRVVWPNAEGTMQTFTDLAVDRTLRIVEGQAPEALNRPPVPFRLETPSHDHSSARDSSARDRPPDGPPDGFGEGVTTPNPGHSRPCPCAPQGIVPPLQAML